MAQDTNDPDNEPRDWGDPVADRVKRDVLLFEIGQLLPQLCIDDLVTIRDASVTWAAITTQPPALRLQAAELIRETG